MLFSSMAIEALRQLGGMYESVVSTSPQHKLPLLSCDNCEHKFHTTADLNVHIISCKNLDNKKFKRCAFCTTMFYNERDYDGHNCDSVDQWPCKFCSEKLPTNLDLIKHIRTTHNNESKPYKCHLCYQKFPRHSSLSNHLKIHNYQPGRALFVNCNTSYNKPEDNKRHSVKLPSWSADTDYISDSAENISIDPLANWNFNYNSNTIQIEPQEMEVEEELLNSVVQNSNDTPIDFQIPVKVEQMSFSSEIEKCIEDPFAIANIPQIEVSVDSNSVSDKRPHVCTHCGMSFSRQKALQNHVKLHTINWESSHECEHCNETFPSKDAKLKHLEYCTKKEPLDSTSTFDRNKMNVPKAKRQLKNEKPQVKVGKHPCPDCDKRFATKQKMFRHMWIHRKKTFTCEMCAMSFEEQPELDKHRLSEHPTDSPYVCQECGKAFASRQGLWEHGRVHGGGGTGLSTCLKCNKTFASRQGYLIHQRTHTGERPYGCRYCLKAFRDGGTLRKHERIHTGERPHICPICLHDFNQKVVLREHVRWVHTANSEPNENGSFGCSLCELQVTDKEELCAHIVKHSDQMALEMKNAKSQTNANIEENQEVNNESPTRVINRENYLIVEKVENIEVEECFVPDNNETNENFEGNKISDVHQCDMCGLKLTSLKELMAHVHIHI